MAINVTKVADIVAGEIVLCRQSIARSRGLLPILTNLEPAADPDPRTAELTVELEVGKGPAARVMHLPLPPLLSKSNSPQDPVLFADGKLVYFRDQLFMPERQPRSSSEREEIALRVKKACFDDEAGLVALRSQVANLEAVMEYSKSAPRRDQIPEDVKLLVWARDGGACLRCGAKQELHFDHIIPVAKGGGNSQENIQILCKRCNLQKSDKISS
jgi:hypothetical protein